MSLVPRLTSSFFRVIRCVMCVMLIVGTARAAQAASSQTKQAPQPTPQQPPQPTSQAAQATSQATKAGQSQDNSSIDCSYHAQYPRQYVVYKLKPNESILMDGKLDDEAWGQVGWTEAFEDISSSITPRLETRLKMRYDQDYLYFGGILHDPAIFANISSTCHCNQGPGHECDQVIFHDNDFEIFVDADGSTHNYKEFEVNALNATWDLLLNKPYGDGGYENSTRVFGPQGFDDLRPWGGVSSGMCRTHVHGGQINNPKRPTKYWTVEVALPFDKLAFNTTKHHRPRPQKGEYWRADFSRVQWAVSVHGGKYWKEPSCQSCPVPGSPHEDNWVWSRIGVVAMHNPERWGYLQFADDRVNSTSIKRDPQWAVRSIASYIYYAQHAYKSDPSLGNGSFTEDVNALRKAKAEPPVEIPFALDGVCSRMPDIKVGNKGTSFEATIISNDGNFAATIRDDRYLTVSDSIHMVL